MSYKTEIRVSGDPKYYPNGVTFAFEEEAKEYGLYKLSTWSMAENFRVVQSDEPVNYAWDSTRGLVDAEVAQ